MSAEYFKYNQQPYVAGFFIVKEDFSDTVDEPRLEELAE